MIGGPLATRYAKAILALAVEQGKLDEVTKNLTELKATYEESDQLQDVLENPAFTQQVRRQVLEALAAKMGLGTIVRNTVLLLSDRGRMRHLPDIVDAYDALAEEKAGRVRAEVVTATDMPEAYFAELQKALEGVTGKRVVLARRTDPDLIGGVVARVGDKVFDGSIKNRLDELKDELLNR